MLTYSRFLIVFIDIINFIIRDGNIYLMLFNINKGVLENKQEYVDMIVFKKINPQIKALWQVSAGLKD